MKIVHISSEVAPFAKTGGLADVLGSLSTSLGELGHEVLVFMPLYRAIRDEYPNLERELDSIKVSIGNTSEQGSLFKLEWKKGVTVYFVEQRDFFYRDHLYGNAIGDFPDNDRRFIFFQRAVLESLKKMNFKADVIHCHDWQTGLIPVYLKTIEAKRQVFKKTKSVFTIHNLAYQGNFPPDSLPLTGLSWDLYRYELMEFYGKYSFMKAGIVFSDFITTVSERYSREIQTKEFGCGLEGALKERKEFLSGIVNGIAPEEWDPSNDSDLPASFSKEHLSGKAICRAELIKRNEFSPEEDKPLFAYISRLVDQKGVDVLIDSLDELKKLKIRLVILGTGDERYHKILREVAKEHRDWLRVRILFDPKLAKLMYAGSDFFLMPSYYEPCGLGQMIALRYGTIPIVRKTGGLADTIEEYNPVSGNGNGFVFDKFDTKSLIDSMRRALKIYKKEKEWKKIVSNAFDCNFSWKSSAEQYLYLYENMQKIDIEVDSQN